MSALWQVSRGWFTTTIFLLSGGITWITWADEVYTVAISDSIQVQIVEAPFHPNEHLISLCPDSELLCLIDGEIPYGAQFYLPQTYLKNLTLIVGGSRYKLDTSNMYDAWRLRPSVHNLSADCSDAKSCTLRGLFADGANTYAAEWQVTEGRSRRTLLTSSEEIVSRFTLEIVPGRYE